MRFEADRWLTDVLARPVFSVHDVANHEPCPGEALREHASSRPGAFYFAKLSTLHVDTAGKLTACGFRVVETHVTFSRPIGGALPIDEQKDFRVEPATPALRDRVLDIAGSAFRYSRFHLDPAFDRSSADKVKREWIRSYFDKKRGDLLLVGRKRFTPVGFLALMMQPEQREVAVIDLVGVAPEHQGKGLGQHLIAAALDASRNCAQVLEVGTQAANIPSIRLYERLGFRAVRASYVLHYHAA
jgi:ribosomal protein S18 acetylase RimI-like enzyme